MTDSNSSKNLKVHVDTVSCSTNDVEKIENDSFQKEVLKEKKIVEELESKLRIKDDCESNGSHIKNIDLYDRLNFQRIQVKRSSLKAKTNVVRPKLNITKYTEEIIKYVEEIPEVETNKVERKRQRTIKFSTQKVTFQYPKEKEVIKSHFNDIKEEEEEKPKTTINNEETEENKKGFIIFGEDDEEEASHHHSEHEEDGKQHINLNIYEEKN